MWLNEINKIDMRWPKEDEEDKDEHDDEDVSDKCVAYLHRLRTMKLLKEVIEELGDDNFAALCGKYNVDETCGFDMKMVMEGDRTLIKQEVIGLDDEDEND